VGFQEGVRDFVGEDGVFVIKVIVGCKLNSVYVVSFFGVHVGAFFVYLHGVEWVCLFM
jgi:hypothetical protein